MELGENRLVAYTNDQEGDDANNVSRDDSEDFAVEDTAFFRSTSGASDPPSGSGLVSPVASPTPFGTPRVWSTHSLYGEALVQSTRQLSTSNNTCSTMADDDEKLLTSGLQQPHIPEEEGIPVYEDLLVSPTSPASDTPTTPPSVAPKPALSPPPLILTEMREEPQQQDSALLVVQPAASTTILATTATTTTTTTTAANSTNHILVPPPESMSYSSRTPLRPPRVPGNPSGRGPNSNATSHTTSNSINNNNNNNNNSGHRRQHQHHRMSSDSSFLSALTDVSFGSVQTAPPPPRSLPLPLLSAASSWTRYTNNTVGNHLPVLENHNNVSGMNISVPSSLQQPVLSDDENNYPQQNTGTIQDVPPSSHPPPTSTPITTGSGAPLHRQSTPPRHRPPKDNKLSATQHQQKVARTNALFPQSQKLPKSGMSSSLAASSQALARQRLQNQSGGPRSPGNGPFVTSTNTGTVAAFLPIPPPRTRSYSSDAADSQASSSSPKAATKPRSYSSDVLLPPPPPLPERNAAAGTQSLPGICLTSPVDASWEPICHDNVDTCGPIQLEEWLGQAFSRVDVSPQRGNNCSSTDLFGSALLALAMPSNVHANPQEDLPLRKIGSATSTVSDVSRLSTSTRQVPQPDQEVKMVRPSAATPGENRRYSVWPEFAVIAGIFAALLGQILTHGSETNLNRLLVFVFVEQPFLLLLSVLLAYVLPQYLDPSPKTWPSSLPNAFSLVFFLSRGWPRVMIIWGILEFFYFRSMGNTTLFQSTQNVFLFRLPVVAFVAGISEAFRRSVVGVALHTLLYRRFCRKVQRTLQRIAVVRNIARYTRIPIRDCFETTDEPESASGQVSLKDLLTFQKIYAALRSDKALSPEFGSVSSKKELKASASTLYDAIAVQGRVRLASLQEAAVGSDVIWSLVQVIFASSPSGIVSQADFVAAIEALRQDVDSLLGAIDNEISLLHLVDTLSSLILNITLLSLGLGSIVPLALSVLVALVCAVAMSTCCESVIFALFARPYELGDVVFLNCVDDLPIQHEHGWKVDDVGVWNTRVSRKGISTGVTVLSNSSLARCRITTFDSSVPAVVSLRLQAESHVSRQKLKEFRKAVEEYLKDHSSEWIDLLSLQLIDFRDDSTEYELRLRHRQPVGNLRAIRQSRVDLMRFCNQTQVLLGMSTISPVNLAKDAQTYNDDLSEDTVAETDNELYFLTNTS